MAPLHHHHRRLNPPQTTAPPRRLVSLKPEKDANSGESVVAHGDLIAISTPNEQPGRSRLPRREGLGQPANHAGDRGVPGTSEPGDHFGEHLALGPLV
ncbi:hypothetical protein [Nonomuraea fuscirosea]|uniref:hypothetical protein n=1 Tax=Nonomuraea fuscirosea TaxID=1291556 RepID=UPI0011B1F9B9|nr:hypothetical protein [Nonomuraea fuscirosea]